jgi:hypothetical protein
MSNKANIMAVELQTELARRFATVSAVKFDTDSNPYVLVGAGTAGSQSAVVKVLDFPILGVDIVGVAARNYGNPVEIQVVEETSTIAATPLLTAANQIALMGAVALRGARVLVYLTANTVVVAPGAGTLVATFDPDLKYKQLSQM